MKELPHTFQTYYGPFCKDEEKYKVVDDILKEMENSKRKSKNF